MTATDGTAGSSRVDRSVHSPVTPRMPATQHHDATQHSSEYNTAYPARGCTDAREHNNAASTKPLTQHGVGQTQGKTTQQRAQAQLTAQSRTGLDRHKATQHSSEHKNRLPHNRAHYTLHTTHYTLHLHTTHNTLHTTTGFGQTQGNTTQQRAQKPLTAHGFGVGVDAMQSLPVFACRRFEI